MKIKKISIAIVAGAAVLLSSCVTDAGVWGASVSYASPGFSSSVAWTNASYDVNGFPIYGYAYGRPVYGYTAAGAAIFSIAALTAWCYVPDWGPALGTTGPTTTRTTVTGYRHRPNMHRGISRTSVPPVACMHPFTRTRPLCWVNP